MALEAFTARANTGAGTDQIAVVSTSAGKAGAVALVDDGGALISAGNPVPVSGTFWQATQPVSAAALPLPTGATTSLTATGLTLLTVTNLPRTYRLAWTITGTTPSFTFSVGIAPVI